MTTPWPASGTPYVVPVANMLQSLPVGVAWDTIPPGTNVTDTQKAAALADVCMIATSSVNGEVNFPLHCITNTETVVGPDYYATVRNSTGMGRVILSRWPVTNIISVAVAPAAVFPRQWTTVPAGYYQPEWPVIGHPSSNVPSGSGEGGQAVLIAPPYLNWNLGRFGYAIQVVYNHGWPHTSLAAGAVATATTISVNDCTGWGPFAPGQVGAGGVIFDNLGGQEPITVTAASATSGPGTLTLAAPLTYAHPTVGTMVSSLPMDVIWAAALFAGAEALTRGAQATVVQSVPGHGAGSTGAAELRERACVRLRRFARTI